MSFSVELSELVQPKNFESRKFGVIIHKEAKATKKNIKAAFALARQCIAEQKSLSGCD